MYINAQGAAHKLTTILGLNSSIDMNDLQELATDRKGKSWKLQERERKWL